VEEGVMRVVWFHQRRKWLYLEGGQNIGYTETLLGALELFQ
jgi:hypothetical protein